MYFRDSLICMVCKVYGLGCLSLGLLFLDIASFSESNRVGNYDKFYKVIPTKHA